MVYDEQRRHVLMFGGYDDPLLLGDTWAFDGRSWRQLTAGPQPAPRAYANLTYDSRRALVLMLGGQIHGARDGTWEHDGSQWLSRGTGGPDDAGCMAYDRARGAAVMVLGATSGGPVSTWEWNGLAWLQRATAQAPSMSGGMSMVYDPLRQRVVLVGGIPNGDGVWEWNGNSWAQVATLTQPPRLRPALWFDPALGKLVVAGGSEVQLNGTSLGGRTDAWTWDGVTTAPLRGDHRPAARNGHAFFADLHRDRLVLFGGARWPLPPLNDTWLWDGVAWTESQPVNRPPARNDAATAFDWTRSQGLLFGGTGSTGQPLGDLWSWDGIDWSPRGGGGPDARSGAAMSYDITRDVTVLFGGLAGPSMSATNLRNDTWEWTGAAWLQRTPAFLPPPRTGAAMGFDLTRNRTMLYGGRFGPMVGELHSDVWEWDGSGWRPAASPPAPPLMQPSLHFDTSRWRMVLTGTQAVPGGGVRHVWEYDGVAWTQRWSGSLSSWAEPCALLLSAGRVTCALDGRLHEFSSTGAAVAAAGTSCGAPALVLSARTRPRVGESAFGLDCATTPGLPIVFAFAATTASTPLGNGCTLLLGQPGTSVFTLGGANGMAAVPLPIPRLYSLRGLTLFAQSAVLDPASPGGLRLSQGLRVQVGD
jgi:hypothetical protein